jgi:hypothetical protein
MSLSEVSVELPAYGLSSKEKVKSYTENLVKGKNVDYNPKRRILHIKLPSRHTETQKFARLVTALLL